MAATAAHGAHKRVPHTFGGFCAACCDATLRACAEVRVRFRAAGILTALRIALLLIAAAGALPAFAQSIDAEVARAEAPLDAAARVAVALVRALPVPADARVEVNTLPFDSRIRVGACPVPLQADLVGRPLSGSRASVRVRCTDTEAGWSVAVALKVALLRRVLVARSPLVRGDTLDPSNVDVAERDVLQAGYGYLDNLEAIAGARVLRPVRAGAMLVPGAIAARLLVERESRVTLIARGPDIDVRAAGTALDGGSARQKVRVRNLSSGRILTGTVESEGVVAIGP